MVTDFVFWSLWSLAALVGAVLLGRALRLLLHGDGREDEDDERKLRPQA